MDQDRTKPGRRRALSGAADSALTPGADAEDDRGRQVVAADRRHEAVGLTRTHLGIRFVAEIAGASLAAILLVLTVVVPDWIEAVFRVSPDGGDGILERVVVAVLALAAAVSGLLAERDRRRFMSHADVAADPRA